MKYELTIIDTNRYLFVVEADSYDEAIQTAREHTHNFGIDMATDPSEHPKVLLVEFMDGETSFE